MTLLSSLNTALSGLLSYQKAIEVTSHNVANVNTPGYHRQEAVLKTGIPYPEVNSAWGPNGGQYGTGVNVAYVRRMQDYYLQQQSDQMDGQIGRWQMTSDNLHQIEGFLIPGQGLDLSTMIDNFFGAWQRVVTNPEELAGRTAVRSAGMNLTNMLNDMVGRLDSNANLINTTIADKVDEINLLTDQLAELNAQIGMAQTEARAPNDLLDQRELILSKLSMLVGATSAGTSDRTTITSLGGRVLVEGNIAYHLQAVPDIGGMQVVWAADGQATTITRGEIAGMLDVRDNIVPAYRVQLDAVANALSTSVNALHVTGMTMTGAPASDFFTGTTAGSIRLADPILASAQAVAAARVANAPGDSSLAKDIYALYRTQLIGNQTLNASVEDLAGQIGNAVVAADNNLTAVQSLRTQLERQQQEVGGVSLDEEMSSLLTSQHAYDASARVFTTIDEMMRTLIDRVGA